MFLMLLRNVLVWLCLSINKLIEKIHQPKLRMEARNYFQLPRANSFHNGKPKLLLGLEGTIVCTDVKRRKEWDQIQIKFKSGTTQDFYIKYRPFLNEFLNEISKIYNISIYTTQVEEFAIPIINSLCIPIKNSFYRYKQFLFFTQSCLTGNRNFYVKEIGLITDNPHNVILVDCDKKQIEANSENSLEILQFTGDEKDIELLKLKQLLIQADNILKQQRENDPGISIQEVLRQLEDE